MSCAASGGEADVLSAASNWQCLAFRKFDGSSPLEALTLILP
jgi:hypothetical protein